MNTKVIMAIMLVLSMFMVGSAYMPEEEVTEHEGSFDYYSDTSYCDPNDYSYIEVDAQYQYTQTDYGYQYSEYEGTVDAHGEMGHVCVEGDTTTTDSVGANIHADVYVEIYDDEYGYIYAEAEFEGNHYTGHQVDTGNYHTYFEEGYNFGGCVWYCSDDFWEYEDYGFYIDYCDYYSFSRSWSDVKPERVENLMTSPSAYTLGNPGDIIPVLYTWAEVDNKFKHHTTTEFPAEGTYYGCVIVTPSQIIGEPFPNNGNIGEQGARGDRIAEWYNNHAE